MAEAPKPPRRKPALAARILTGGFSVAATLGMVAGLGLQQSSPAPEPGTAPPTPASSPPPRRIIVRVVRRLPAQPTVRTVRRVVRAATPAKKPATTTTTTKTKAS